MWLVPPLQPRTRLGSEKGNLLLNSERKGVALYTQLASVFRARILNGEWKVGDQLPSIPELCAAYGVGTITVRQALAALSAEGLVNSARGRGTFVTGSVVPTDVNEALRDAINDPLQLAPGQTIDLLLRERVDHLPPSLQTSQSGYDGYVHIRAIHRHEGEPYGLMDTFIAAETADRFPKGDEGRFKAWYLIRKYGRISLKTARQEMMVTYADQETAALLSSRASDYNMSGVLVRARRWWTDEQDRVAYAGLYLYRADRFVLDFTQPLSPGDSGGSELIPSVRKEPRPQPRRRRRT